MPLKQNGKYTFIKWLSSSNAAALFIASKLSAISPSFWIKMCQIIEAGFILNKQHMDSVVGGQTDTVLACTIWCIYLCPHHTALANL